MTDQRIVSAASFLIHAECQRIGRQWEQQGINSQVRQAIEDDGRRVDLVVTAGFAAAADDRAVTPAAIRWASRYPDVPDDDAPPAPRCDVCGRPEHGCRIAAAKSGDHHQFTTEPPTPARTRAVR